MTDYDKYWDFLGGLAFITGRYLPEKIGAIIEYGGGYSTFLFSLIAEYKKSQTFCSVDQYGPYLDRLTECMPKSNTFTPMLAELFSEDRMKAEAPDTLYYGTAPLSLGVPYDLVLIDGRARMECLLVSALACGEEAVVILDDSDRIRYTPGLMFYEQVDKVIRFRVLKLRPEAKPIRDRFAAARARYAAHPVAKPRTGHMLHVPEVAPLTAEELGELKTLVGRFAGGDAPLAYWGREDGVLALEGAPAKPSYHIGDKQSPALDRPDWISVMASLTGNLMDNSRDQDLHYSTAPLFWKTKFGLMVVAGHRGNECMLTAAFALAPGGIMILRDSHLLHHGPGLTLYEPVERLNSFSAFRLTDDASALVAATSKELSARIASAQILAPGKYS